MKTETTITPEVGKPTANDTFRRDLIARLYVAMVGGAFAGGRVMDRDRFIEDAILSADTLIEAMEAQP